MECLVTKLKGTVNDSGLFKLGEMSITIKAGSQARLDLQYGEETQVYLIGDGYFTDSSYSANNGKTKKLTANNVNNVYIKTNGECSLRIPKYNIQWIDANGKTASIYGGLDTLKYSTNLKHLTFVNDCYGDIENLRNCPLVLLNLAATDCCGDIEVLSDKIDITSINLAETHVDGNISSLMDLDLLETLYLTGTNVIGDISAFASMSSLKNLYVGDTESIQGDITSLTQVSKLDCRDNHNLTGNVKNLSAPVTELTVYNSGITGKIEDFVAKQRASGRTTGSCSNGGYSWGNLTFKGEPIALGSDTLIWTATQITCKGEQITA